MVGGGRGGDRQGVRAPKRTKGCKKARTLPPVHRGGRKNLPKVALLEKALGSGSNKSLERDYFPRKSFAEGEGPSVV